MKSTGRNGLTPRRRNLRSCTFLVHFLCLPQCCVPVEAPVVGEASVAESAEALPTVAAHRYLRAEFDQQLVHRSLVDRLFSFFGIERNFLIDNESPIDVTEDVLNETTTFFYTRHLDTPSQDSQNSPYSSITPEDESRILQADNGWYVDWVSAQCVQSCNPLYTTNPNCAGLASRQSFTFLTASDCCKTMIPWQSLDKCTRLGPPEATLNKQYEMLSTIENFSVTVEVPKTGSGFQKGESKPKNQIHRPKETKVCYRSGMPCGNMAQKFACCSTCKDGFCI